MVENISWGLVGVSSWSMSLKKVSCPWPVLCSFLAAVRGAASSATFSCCLDSLPCLKSKAMEPRDMDWSLSNSELKPTLITETKVIIMCYIIMNRTWCILDYEVHETFYYNEILECL